jgi:hypothetical protein
VLVHPCAGLTGQAALGLISLLEVNRQRSTLNPSLQAVLCGGVLCCRPSKQLSVAC